MDGETGFPIIAVEFKPVMFSTAWFQPVIFKFRSTQTIPSRMFSKRVRRINTSKSLGNTAGKFPVDTVESVVDCRFIVNVGNLDGQGKRNRYQNVVRPNNFNVYGCEFRLENLSWITTVPAVTELVITKERNEMILVRYAASDAIHHGCLSECRQFVKPFPKGFDLNEILKGAETPTCIGEEVAVDTIDLLAPIPNPQKVICVGKNYADHAREMGGEPPTIPVIFNKFPTAINHPGAEIILPEISDKVDFEAELVAVIGNGGKSIPTGQGLDHVFGYCCGNDISARDWQKEKPGGQWLLGKTFDGFAPLGPWLVSADQVDPGNLDIALRLNGDTMQESNTRYFLFDVGFLVEHISQFCELMPGDLIFTGTPAGVGAGRTPPLYLKSGDVLEVEIQGLGVLENRMV